MEQRPILPAVSKEFRVLNKDPGTGLPIENRDILQALEVSAQSETEYRKEYSFYSGSGRYTKGVKSKIEGDSSFKIYYLNNYESLMRHQAGLFKVTFNPEFNNLKSVGIECPAQLEVYDSFKTGKDDVWLPQEKVAADLERICKRISINISRFKSEKSEINVKFPSESVYANFFRKLSPVTGADKIEFNDIEKAKVFWISSGGVRLQLAISVFPYRQGSKVVYAFRYPYSVKGDGTSTFSSAEIKELHKNIERIAND